MKKKIAISEVKFMCDADDIENQKNCPYYENKTIADNICLYICNVNHRCYGECCCDEAIEAYISKGFKG